MWLDPFDTHKGLELSQVVVPQLEMWRYESHAWVVQRDGRLRCGWCGRERMGNFSPATNPADRDVPLCLVNPVVEQFMKSVVQKVQTLSAAAEDDGR